MQTFVRLQLLLDQRQRRRLVFVLAGTLIAGLLEMIGIGAIPTFVGLLIEPDHLLAALPQGNFRSWTRQTSLTSLTLFGAGLLLGLFLLKNFYLAGLIYIETELTQGIAASVSNRLFRAYLYNPYTFHLQRNPAELIRNLTDEAVYAVEFIKAGMRLVREGLVAIVIFLLLMVVDPLLSLSVFSLLAIASGSFYFVLRRSLTRRGQLSEGHWSGRLQVISQSLGAIKEAKILGREPHLIDLFSREVNGIRCHDTFYQVVSALPKLFLELLAVGTVLFVAAAFVLFGRPIQIMLPMLVLFGASLVRLVPSAIYINSSLTDIRYRRPAFDLVCTELETVEIPLACQSRTGAAPLGVKKLQHAVRLQDISYRYPGTSVNALEHVSLEIKAGETVAFIGISGVGKSTLIDLILGLLTPISGQVCVDGCDIRHSLPDWQRQIGYIPQDIYLLDDTIRRNIAFGLATNEIDDVALTRALKSAQLETFVWNLPNGIDTMIGNRGVRLSGGQRQRIGIARALYHDPGVLVMDEATNALDDETEHEVIEAIDRLRSGRTIIMVAHRLTTVRGCDRLYLLEGGRVKDEGTYTELATRHTNLRLPTMEFASDGGKGEKLSQASFVLEESEKANLSSTTL